TNDWHGSLFEFLRNGNLNARNFFAPVHDSLKRNQFGGTFGGRIIRDKLFFFGGFQGTINRSAPPQQVAFVPTTAVLNGDFSPIFLNSAHVTFTRRRNDRDAAAGIPNAASLGINIPTGPPTFVPVTSYFSIGCSNCKTAFFNVNSWSLTDDVDVIRGKHQMA